MRDAVLHHVRAMLEAHTEFAVAAPEEAFSQKLPVPSNTVGGQFWCVIGARESYANAILNNRWIGFNCSLSGSAATDKASVVKALAQSALAFDHAAASVDWTLERDALLLDLLEQKPVHQGEFIRYTYGLGLRFPESWANRWSLAQPSG